MLQIQSCINLTQLKRCVIAIKSLHDSYCWTEFQDGCSSKCLKTVLSDMIIINLLISKLDFTKLVSVIIGKDDQQLSLRILQKQNRLQSIYVPTKPTHKSCYSNLPFDTTIKCYQNHIINIKLYITNILQIMKFSFNAILMSNLQEK